MTTRQENNVSTWQYIHDQNLIARQHNSNRNVTYNDKKTTHRFDRLTYKCNIDNNTILTKKNLI